MSVQKYPWSVSIYKGENRILIIPLVRHVGGYSIHSEYFFCIKDMENAEEIGNCILKAVKFIKDSPISSSTGKERKENAAWKKNSKYKGWVSFWENNYCADFSVYENGEYQLNLPEKMMEHKGGYSGSIKMIFLPPTAVAEEIGKAVIDVFKVAEEYYDKTPAYDPYPTKSLVLLDGSTLTVKHPSD